MLKLRAFKLTLATALLFLAGCATIPNGPSIMALPGSGKNFDQFRADDLMCRQYATQAIGGMTPNQAATDSAVRSAAVGTVVGAAAGAAIGGNRGAGVGAGTGLLMGSVAGAADASSYGAQRRYDNAYIQCMYGHGHRVPVSGRLMSDPERASRPSGSIPPPPPGSPPPPPPDAPRY
ncbi:hypothetical protein SKTS_34830 [Sulfurimicrobium lacus]|uniref:Glycine-zipper-containing OmpA-like membrane domain-containing protein n=1 Tax=Sulfurimicrobium lacus TaxID=2715678 RepID=A0A6F8VHL9_9PROT|nr:YMGG-like glycine zipper-containing protein [Sulfurimicrobium lacus]BCB28597.1 hypothetical protein SKTS_34830 [Sulfurimicrobium lacus]